jgi:transposase-like protein
VLPVSKAETCWVDVTDYPGGLALWGAVPPVYDTTRLPLDRGVHLHARTTVGGPKDIDATFRSVVLTGLSNRDGPVTVSELDAIYYMVSSVFGFAMRHVECTACGAPHLDRDWFSVHPHRRHLCAGCGRTFRDTETGIGNPIWGLRSAHSSRPSKKSRRICQRDFPGGVQVWGSNAAFVWTSRRSEMEGVHLHAFEDGNRPTIDDTYASVEIDGIRLDADLVRISMAQQALPHISGRTHSFSCPSCGAEHADIGEMAFTPHERHECARCGEMFSSSTRKRKTIGNPMLGVLQALANFAPRAAQRHDLGLIPETL